jgi:hypothetical protein
MEISGSSCLTNRGFPGNIGKSPLSVSDRTQNRGMSGNDTQNLWFGKVLEQLRALEGVEYDVLKDGRIALRISYNGKSAKLVMADPAGDYRAQKDRCDRIRETLTELGIVEGMELAPAKRPGRAMTPESIAASAKRRKEFDAWQELWRTIREAERSLDVEFEIAQMRDYY